jgi:hypothetical protein
LRNSFWLKNGKRSRSPIYEIKGCPDGQLAMERRMLQGIKVRAETAASSYFQTLADFLYYGLDRQGWTIHMLFFCLGGILWHYLFYSSKVIPRIFAAWGLVAVSLVFVNVLAALYDRDAELVMIMLVPYLVFEALIGPWFMVKGIKPYKMGS